MLEPLIFLPVLPHHHPWPLTVPFRIMRLIRGCSLRLRIERLAEHGAHDYAWVGMQTCRTELDAKSPDVASDRGTWRYWDESKLSFDSFISLLILITFFSFIPKSGKRISILSMCRDQGLAHQDLWRPAFVLATIHETHKLEIGPPLHDAPNGHDRPACSHHSLK